MTQFSLALDLEGNTGITLDNLDSMEGSLILFHRTIEEMRDHPKIAVAYVENGVITKQLLAIHQVLMSLHGEILEEMLEASKTIQILSNQIKGAQSK